MSGNDVPALGAAHRAALAGGKTLVCECPPAWWTLQAVFSELTAPSSDGLHTVVLVPEIEGFGDNAFLMENTPSLGRVHVASGIARTVRLLKAGQVSTLIAAAADLLRLVELSAIRTDTLAHVIIAWRETFNTSTAEACETVLAEFRAAARIVVTTDTQTIQPFIDHHARRAPVYRFDTVEVDDAKLRYAVVPPARKPGAVRAAMDIINPVSTVVWDPCERDLRHWAIGLVDESAHADPVDLAIALDLPSAEVLNRLSARAREVLVLLSSLQLPFLRLLAPNGRSQRLPSSADRARQLAEVRRAELRERLEGSVPLDVLTTIGPLLDEFDPVMIAAAAVSGAWSATRVPDAATWTTIRVDKGKKDGLRAGDLVGALVNAVGIKSSDVGRIALRDTFSLIELRPEDAGRAVRGLTGLQVKQQRLSARPDEIRRAEPRGKPATRGSGRP